MPNIHLTDGFRNRLLREMQRLGHHCTAGQLQDAFDSDPTSVSHMLRLALDAGLIRREEGQGAKGAYWYTALYDADLRPVVPTKDARGEQERTCIKCRHPFKPPYKFKFRCARCDRILEREDGVAGLSAQYEGLI